MDAEHPAAKTFKQTVAARDTAALRRLFAEEPGLREVIDAPWFSFGTPALVEAAQGPDRELIEALLDLGADPDARSDWEAGPYTALHRLVDRKPPMDQDLADRLIERGATLDLHAAAGLGRLDDVDRLLTETPDRVGEPGPDGATPLHLALTVEVAAMLLERGADIERRCVDHRSTPIQWSTNGRPEVTRYLLERGAKPDLFIAAYLDDRALAERLLASEPSAIEVAVRFGHSHPHVGFGDKYVWSFDFADTPIEVARRGGCTSVHRLLYELSRPAVRLVQAARAGDLAAIEAMTAEDPELVASLSGGEARSALLGTLDAARLLLGLGVDPDGREEGTGATAAHDAAWNGDRGRLELLAAAGADLSIRDRIHSSPPAGWARVAGHETLVAYL
ncbi:MAG: ankyrin repeat domain-containing protein [Thermoanaerobaculia bacterium]|nr:ankyrin repeat domain-containing protein [Thermoanaerobaculia bacterium]